MSQWLASTNKAGLRHHIKGSTSPYVIVACTRYQVYECISDAQMSAMNIVIFPTLANGKWCK